MVLVAILVFSATAYAGGHRYGGGRSSDGGNFFEQLDQTIKAWQERSRREKEEKDRKLQEERERQEAEKLERDRIEREKVEQERIEQEKRAEQARIEQARVDLKSASMTDLVEKLKDKKGFPAGIQQEKYAGLILDELESRGSVAIPALVLLKDYPAPITEILGRIQTKCGVSGMAPALKDPNVAVRIYASETLGMMGPEAIPILAQATKDESSTVRIKVIEALGKLEAKEATPVLIGATKDTDKNVRLCAIDTLTKTGAKEVLTPVLIAALKDKEPDIRVKSIEALGAMGADAKTAVPILTRMLKDKDADIVRSAICTLGKIGKDAKSAVPVLIQIASKGETNAYDALESIGTPEAKAAVESYRRKQRAAEEARVSKEIAEAKAKRVRFLTMVKNNGSMVALERIQFWVATTKNEGALMLLYKMLGAGTYMDFMYAREKPEAIFKAIEGFSRQGDMGVLILHSQTGLPATVIKGIFDAWRSVY